WALPRRRDDEVDPEAQARRLARPRQLQLVPALGVDDSAVAHARRRGSDAALGRGGEEARLVEDDVDVERRERHRRLREAQAVAERRVHVRPIGANRWRNRLTPKATAIVPCALRSRRRRTRWRSIATER